MVVGLVVALPAVAAVGWVSQRPQRGLLLLLALAPLDGLLLLVPHPAVVEAWTEILLVAVVALAAWRPPEQPDDPSATRHIPTWMWATLALALFAGARTLLDPTLEAAIGLRLTFAFTAVVFVLWRHPFDEFDRDSLVTLLMVAGFVASVVGIVQQVVGAEALNRIGYEYNSTIRTTSGLLRSFSTFNQPFPFAFTVMTAVLVGLPVALSDRSRARNRLFLLVLPVLVLGMSTAFVRAALIGLVIGLFALAVIRFQVLVHALLAMVLVALLALPFVGSALISTSSVDDRTTGWARSTELVMSNPIGSGMGSVGAAAEKVFDEGGGADRFPTTAGDPTYQPDNYYVLKLIELGPLGLWLFVVIIASAWNHARVLGRQRAGADSALALGVAAVVAGAAAAAMASTYWEIFPVDLYFWTLLGVLTSIEYSWASTPSPSDPTVPAFRPTFGSSSEPSGAAVMPG